jgi:hypothetical protein
MTLHETGIEGLGFRVFWALFVYSTGQSYDMVLL